MPMKKNLVIGIDKQQLFDDYGQYLYSVFAGLLGSPSNGWKILIFGCQFALAKFLCDNYENS